MLEEAEDPLLVAVVLHRGLVGTFQVLLVAEVHLLRVAVAETCQVHLVQVVEALD